MINEKNGGKKTFFACSLSLVISFSGSGRGGSGRLRVATQRGMAMHSRAHIMMVFGLSASRSS